MKKVLLLVLICLLLGSVVGGYFYCHSLFDGSSDFADLAKLTFVKRDDSVWEGKGTNTCPMCFIECFDFTSAPIMCKLKGRVYNLQQSNQTLKLVCPPKYMNKFESDIWCSSRAYN